MQRFSRYLANFCKNRIAVRAPRAIGKRPPGTGPRFRTMDRAERHERRDLRALHLEQLARRAVDINNTKFGVQYVPPTQENMLLAYRDPNWAIGPAENAMVRQLFRDRQAWKLGTCFRETWCAIALLRENLMHERGWTEEQIMADTDEQPGIYANSILLLLHGLPPPSMHDNEAARYIAQMNWNKPMENALFHILVHPDFQAISDSLDAAELVRTGIIPQHCAHSEHLVHYVEQLICVCAASRMYCAHVTADVAFAAVLHSGGLSKNFFGKT